jgi:hypothetical protein
LSACQNEEGDNQAFHPMNLAQPRLAGEPTRRENTGEQIADGGDWVR